jgi:hypothetical protein
LSEPSRDPAFSRFLSAWGDGSLGPDKDEGYGLMWKDGYISCLLITLWRRAPLTMRALGDQLADGAPPFGEDREAYIPRRLISDFVSAMGQPPQERKDRLRSMEIAEPLGDLHYAFKQIAPPMGRKYRLALEAWLDLAATIEDSATAQSPTAAPAFGLGARVRHAQWGDGVVRELKHGSVAIVDFGAAGSKKVVTRFLALVS